MIKIIYFVHGTTLDNEKNVSSGWVDVDLSDLGVQQSIDLREKIKGQHFDAVFCSDLVRAVHSADLTFGDAFSIIQDKRLRECNYGDFNAHPSDIVEPLQEKNILVPFPHGESYEDVVTRVADFLKDLKANYDGQTIAIVSHKAPQLALDVLLLGKTWAEAFAEDWRKSKSWRPGWEYTVY